MKTRDWMAVLWTALGIAPACACVLPVYKYALLQWPPDNYAVHVFLDRAPNDKHRAAIREIARHADSCFPAEFAEAVPGPRTANFTVRVYRTDDVGDSAGARAREILDAAGPVEFPFVVVTFPPAVPSTRFAWHGPLDSFPVDAFFDSPIRDRLARRLASGQTAVWILLRGSKEEENRRAESELNRLLAIMQRELRLPDVPPERLPQWAKNRRDMDLRIEFSVLTVSRDDSREQGLVHILESLLPPALEGDNVPALFPVFARGRVLTFLPSSQLTDSTVRSVCAFLTGECGCEVKMQNPGIDLPVTANWDALVQRSGVVELADLPPLAGFERFVGGINAGGGWGQAEGFPDVSPEGVETGMIRSGRKAKQLEPLCLWKSDGGRQTVSQAIPEIDLTQGLLEQWDGAPPATTFEGTLRGFRRPVALLIFSVAAILALAILGVLTAQVLKNR